MQYTAIGTGCPPQSIIDKENIVIAVGRRDGEGGPLGGEEGGDREEQNKEEFHRMLVRWVWEMNIRRDMGMVSTSLWKDRLSA